MGKVRTGYNQKTMENLHTGAGAYFKNFVVGVDTYETARTDGKLLGAIKEAANLKQQLKSDKLKSTGCLAKQKALKLSTHGKFHWE